MGYLHIDNLYKNQDILAFKECYALEKIHGTSAHISYNMGSAGFFSGGAKYEEFVSLFNKAELESRFSQWSFEKVTVYGEAYGGKMQRMKETYGDRLRFVAFDVRIGDSWLAVPNAEEISLKLGLEFVHYTRTSTDLEKLDAERDADSIQALRNGCGSGKIREGVILRPVFEVTKNNGERIISKHKRSEFRETATPRDVDPTKQLIWEGAERISFEWVTAERLRHVLDKITATEVSQTGAVVKAMIEDVNREGAGEFVPSKDIDKAIGKRTAKLFHGYLNARIGSDTSS
jgi:hypothetical protein